MMVSDFLYLVAAIGIFGGFAIIALHLGGFRRSRVLEKLSKYFVVVGPPKADAHEVAEKLGSEREVKVYARGWRILTGLAAAVGLVAVCLFLLAAIVELFA